MGKIHLQMADKSVSPERSKADDIFANSRSHRLYSNQMKDSNRLASQLLKKRGKYNRLI